MIFPFSVAQYLCRTRQMQDASPPDRRARWWRMRSVGSKVEAQGQPGPDEN